MQNLSDTIHRAIKKSSANDDFVNLISIQPLFNCLKSAKFQTLNSVYVLTYIKIK